MKQRHVWMLRGKLKLLLQFRRTPQVIVVEKCYPLAAGGRDTPISRCRDPLHGLPNVSEPTIAAFNHGAAIR
jgi:hypothetical protein